MKKEKYMNGIVLVCDEQGIIERIVRNDFNLPVQEFVNKPVTKLFESKAVTKVMDFLMHLKKFTIAFDYSLSLALNEQVIPLYFTGFFKTHTYYFGLCCFFVYVFAVIKFICFNIIHW